MGLKDKLNQMKEDFKAKAPKEAQDILHRAAEDLKNSGIMERAVKVGDKAPDFTLEKYVRTGCEPASSPGASAGGTHFLQRQMVTVLQSRAGGSWTIRFTV